MISLKNILLLLIAVFCLTPLHGSSLDQNRGPKGEKPDPRLASTHWGENYFPNVELVTSQGEKVRFFDDLIKDKVVMINFIYTRCPDACPLETAKLSELYQILGDRVGKDVFMYSISVDPTFDTPEVLNKYMQTYQIEEGWEFFTGNEEDIILLRRKLGLYIEEVNKDPLDHNLSMIIGNQATGRWMKKSPFENPYILATEIGTWLHNYKAPSEVRNFYQDAPEIRKLTQGESIFRTRCSTCHEIGRSPDKTMKPGPNLLDVSDRRTHEWLVRWIQEPDKMLEEKDPTAIQLFESYNRLPMPNLRVSQHEAEMLLDFIKVESKRMKKVMEVQAIADQQEVEPMDCCQKNEEIVLKEESGPSGQEITAANPGNDSSEIDTLQENLPTQKATATPADTSRRSPLTLISWASGVGLSLLAIRSRKRSEQ
ncbi:MAG: SCO family protein [Planctomycetota bacterium]